MLGLLREELRFAGGWGGLAVVLGCGRALVDALQHQRRSAGSVDLSDEKGEGEDHQTQLAP